MGRKLNIIKSIISRRGTKVSPFAILHDVQYDQTTAIRSLVKMERSSIGKCSSIGTLSAAYDCEIGSFCSIARECYIGGATHPMDWVSTSGCFYLKNNFTGVCYNEVDYSWHTQTKIGNDVWLGVRSIIKGGVTIGDGAVIGAGSVVTKDVGPYEIWAGNPAKLIRKRFDDETIEKLVQSRWWDWDEEELRKYSRYFVKPENLIKQMVCRNEKHNS